MTIVNSMKISLMTTILMLAIASPGIAQAEWRYGFESNVPTFFLDGYHASAWYGKDGLRFRLVSSEAVYPDHFTETGFKDKTLTFLEIEFDYFLGSDASRFRGFWVACGTGRTKQKITSKNSGAVARIETYDFHFGTGYVFELSEIFTLNPWVGGDYHLDTPSTVSVGGETWDPEELELVGGLKVGIDF